MKELLKELGFEHLPMLSEFVNDYASTSNIEFSGFFLWTVEYRDFITQPLTKGMFVPCDEDGEVMEEPTMDYVRERYATSVPWDLMLHTLKEEYQQARYHVLFEGGWTKNSAEWACKHVTIEQLINSGVKLILK